MRPLSAMRPLSSCRPGSALKGRPNSSSRLASGGGGSNDGNKSPMRPATDPTSELSSDASHLTIGPAMQGNPLRGLLARRKQLTKNEPQQAAKERLPQKNSPSTSSTLIATDENDLKLISEINSWKKEHERFL